MSLTKIPADFRGTFRRKKNEEDQININEIFGQIFFSGQWNNQKSSVSGTIQSIVKNGSLVELNEIICSVLSESTVLLAATSKKAPPKNKAGAKTQKKKSRPLKRNVQAKKKSVKNAKKLGKKKK